MRVETSRIAPPLDGPPPVNSNPAHGYFDHALRPPRLESGERAGHRVKASYCAPKRPPARSVQVRADPSARVAPPRRPGERIAVCTSLSSPQLLRSGLRAARRCPIVSRCATRDIYWCASVPRVDDSGIDAWCLRCEQGENKRYIAFAWEAMPHIN